MADSQSELFGLTDSRPELFHTTDGYSECYSHSDLHSMADSQRHLAGSHRDLAGSHCNLAGSRGDLHRMAQSHGDLHRVTRSRTGSARAARCKSHADLLSRRERCATDGGSALHGLGQSFGNLHGGRSATNLHATASSQRPLGRSGLADSQSAFGQLSELSSLKGSRQFRSSPNLQVSRYETAFGPENQTVTRVYYRNGMSTDFHHSAAQEEEDELPPVETHFDVAAESSSSRPQSAYLSFERTSRACDSTGCSESATSRGAVEQSRSFTRPGQEKVCSAVHGSSPRAALTEPLHPAREPQSAENNPMSPVWVTERKPPPYRRGRAERHNTFAGTQFAPGLEMEGRGLEEWDKQLSASTPYLPGLRIGADSLQAPGSLGTRPRQFVSRSAGAAAGGAVKRCSSMYMNCEYCLLFCLLTCICIFLLLGGGRRGGHFVRYHDWVSSLRVSHLGIVIRSTVTNRFLWISFWWIFLPRKVTCVPQQIRRYTSSFTLVWSPSPWRLLFCHPFYSVWVLPWMNCSIRRDCIQSIRDGGKGRIRYLWIACPKRSSPQGPKRPSATTKTIAVKVGGPRQCEAACVLHNLLFQQPCRAKSRRW